MMDTQPHKVPRSRKARGKSAMLCLRVTAEMRQRIEAEVERTGRSISQVAELWIMDGERLDMLLRAYRARADRGEEPPLT